MTAQAEDTSVSECAATGPLSAAGQANVAAANLEMVARDTVTDLSRHRWRPQLMCSLAFQGLLWPSGHETPTASPTA